MKKLIFKIIYTLILSVLVLIIAEGLFRIYYSFDKNRGLKNSMGDINSKYCHVFKPNTEFRLVDTNCSEYDVGVRINNYGFRGNDITKKPSPEVIRIMVIGDSFTFGVGASNEQTIPYLIEKYMNEKGYRVEVINAGFGHYSTILHFMRLKDEYLEFKPDLVLYLFDFSDLADDWRLEKMLVYDKSGKILRCDPVYTDGKLDLWKFCQSKSKLCTYIHRKIVRLVDKIRILGLKNYIKAKIHGKRAKSLIVNEQLKGAGVDPIEYDGYLMIRGREKINDIKRHFKRTEKYLNLVHYILSENGIPMVMVAYPYGIYVGPEQWGIGREYWGFERGRVYDDLYAFDMLEGFAQDNHVPFINVLPEFLADSGEKLFFDIDGHFTPRANEVCARAIIASEVFEKQLSDVVKSRSRAKI